MTGRDRWVLILAGDIAALGVVLTVAALDQIASLYRLYRNVRSLSTI